MHIKAGLARARVVSVLNPHTRRQRDETIALLRPDGMRLRGRAHQDTTEIPRHARKRRNFLSTASSRTTRDILIKALRRWRQHQPARYFCGQRGPIAPTMVFDDDSMSFRFFILRERGRERERERERERKRDVSEKNPGDICAHQGYARNVELTAFRFRN